MLIKRDNHNNLKSADTIVEAFINAAKRYQVQRQDGDAIARVVGYTSAASDTLTTATTVLPSLKTTIVLLVLKGVL